MKIVFIRHGEPDKTYVDEKGFIGLGRDLAPLTENGIMQAKEASNSSLLNRAQIIISSPYTRALYTAAIISKNIGVDILVEVDLHEFLSDKTFMVKGEEENSLLHKEFIKYMGEYPKGETRKWETIPEIIKRTKPVMDKYFDLGYEKIIVVAHGGIIRRYTGIGVIAYGEVLEMEYDKDFKCYGWV
ncbi:histidine phosphatase family protein [Anaerocolumna xylanovorans]|uniref:Broad specificity phosphatase PhoE n=1 Tax=Anaerocolumna xylanovorans DSM 12503 TaxID=1121345 RepID=A0A1M7YKI0_9FIRM|nr:histidine phosphatase family protein [Anaerocolumna xylanovorans]SHO53123.1 Broad specificity phosphatase PhoE [Anaerocolumna xylanovorans DSM 12503]